MLFAPEEDVFDGIVIETTDGERFVDASAVDRIFERCVLTALTPIRRGHCRPPEPGPPSTRTTPRSAPAGRFATSTCGCSAREAGYKEESGEKEMKDEDGKR